MAPAIPTLQPHAIRSVDCQPVPLVAVVLHQESLNAATTVEQQAHPYVHSRGIRAKILQEKTGKIFGPICSITGPQSVIRTGQIMRIGPANDRRPQVTTLEGAMENGEVSLDSVAGTPKSVLERPMT